ncbi:hypothetical protein [Nesterenkonia sp. K-15-9-6]|uniref:hypothetical protein n=1 Tax=Nesterenkonia sp. K-15-9-6 TaxID=3093918 RepID=UPI004044368E
MGDANIWVYLLGGGGLAGILVAFIKGAWDWARGRHEREHAAARDRRDTITLLKSEVRDAEHIARDASEAAHRWREHAHDVRLYCMTQHQTASRDLPRWPDCPRDN